MSDDQAHITDKRDGEPTAARRERGDALSGRPDRGAVRTDNWASLMARAWRLRCPGCGVGKLFDGWRETREACDRCGLVFEPADGDTFGFLYLSTGFLTGVFLLVMFFFWRPATYAGYLLCIVVVVGLMIWSLPRRKALAIALDYLANRAWGETDN